MVFDDFQDRFDIFVDDLHEGLRQEIANLPDAAARDYLTKLFEL